MHSTVPDSFKETSKFHRSQSGSLTHHALRFDQAEPCILSVRYYGPSCPVDANIEATSPGGQFPFCKVTSRCTNICISCHQSFRKQPNPGFVLTTAGYLCILTASEILIYFLGKTFGLRMRMETALQRYPLPIQNLQPLLATCHDLENRCRIVLRLDRMEMCIIDLENWPVAGKPLNLRHAVSIHPASGKRRGFTGPRPIPLLIGIWKRASEGVDERGLAIASIQPVNMAQEGVTLNTTTLPEPMESEPGIGRFVVIRRTQKGNVYARLLQL